MTRGKQFLVVSFNVRGFPAMLQRKVRHDLLLAFGLVAGLVGWQEFWFPRYRRALRKLGHEAGYQPHAPNSLAGTCTSWASDQFGFLEAGQLLLHKALAGVCAHRNITWTKLFDRSSGIVVTHVSTHLVPGAWNPRQRFRKQGRQQRWVEGMDVLRAFLVAEVNAGRHVIVTMDGNCPRTAILNHLGTHLAGAPVRVQGFQPDWVVVVGRAEVDPAEQVQGALSDHKPVAVRMRLLDTP